MTNMRHILQRLITGSIHQFKTQQLESKINHTRPLRLRDVHTAHGNALFYIPQQFATPNAGSMQSTELASW